TQLRITASCLVTLFYFFRGGICWVDQPCVLELFQDIRVDIHALRLTVRLVRPANVDSFIPAQTKPGQRIQNCLVGLLRVTSSINILNAKDKSDTSLAGISPVEQDNANHTNVRRTSGREAKAYAYI